MRQDQSGRAFPRVRPKAHSYYRERRTSPVGGARSLEAVMTMESQSPQPAGIDRRRLLKKAAVGGAVAWTAPVVLSNPAFAQCSSQTGAALSWNVTSPTGTLNQAVWVRSQNDDFIDFRIAIDSTCSCSPSALANGGFSVFILEQPTGSPVSAISPSSSTDLTQTFRISNPKRNGARYVIGFTVQFTCNGVKHCSRRAFEFTTPAGGGRPAGGTSIGVSYPKKYVQPGDPSNLMWNSQQGYATTCCAGGIISGPTCF